MADPRVEDIEKEGSISSETEGSHTHTEDPSSNKHHYEGGFPVVFRGGKEVTSAPPRRPMLYCVATLIVISLVVVLPAVLTDRSDSSSQSSDTNQLQQTTSVVITAPPKLPESLELPPLDTAQCPGNNDTDGLYWEVSSVWALEMALGERGVAEDRTFDVEPSHTVVENGVVFNVETVTEASQEDSAKPIWTVAEIQDQIHQEAAEFYQDAEAARAYPPPPLPNVTLEVMSKDDLPLVYAGNQGFLAACMMAFAQHLPLALSPDDIWTIIAQGFARHVDQNAEALRDHFVAHEGKKEIRIREDRMSMGASPPEQWESLIFPKFSEAIGDNMNNQDAYETLSQKVFSTSTATTQAASEITLMSTLKNYFEYTMVTACGIPRVRLEGTRDDWVALKERTAKLAQWMMPNATHGELWITDIVLPILEEFVQAYDGNVNYCFWQTMVKFRTTGGGSGSYDFLSGWLPTLFPYLSVGGGETEPNPHLRTWQESASALLIGPRPNAIPSQLSSVPVMWEYYYVEYPLHFHAGFRGVTQEADGTLAPVLGWYVTHDPKTQDQAN